MCNLLQSNNIKQKEVWINNKKKETFEKITGKSIPNITILRLNPTNTMFSECKELVETSKHTTFSFKFNS